MSRMLTIVPIVMQTSQSMSRTRGAAQTGQATAWIDQSKNGRRKSLTLIKPPFVEDKRRWIIWPRRKKTTGTNL
jgi:hypothetical protein